MRDTAQRVADPHQVAFFLDGFVSYKTLFHQIFGYPYQPPPRHTHLGCLSKVCYRVPSRAAHVQILSIVKEKNGTQWRFNMLMGLKNGQALIELGL